MHRETFLQVPRARHLVHVDTGICCSSEVSSLGLNLYGKGHGWKRWGNHTCSNRVLEQAHPKERASLGISLTSKTSLKWVNLIK